MPGYKIKNENDIILRDYLARDRTQLAIERTFLAYIRTAIGTFSAGVACVKLINDSPLLYKLGYILMFVSPIILVFGLIRLINAQKKINTIPNNDLIQK